MSSMTSDISYYIIHSNLIPFWNSFTCKLSLFYLKVVRINFSHFDGAPQLFKKPILLPKTQPQLNQSQTSYPGQQSSTINPSLFIISFSHYFLSDCIFHYKAIKIWPFKLEFFILNFYCFYCFQLSFFSLFFKYSGNVYFGI